MAQVSSPSDLPPHAQLVSGAGCPVPRRRRRTGDCVPVEEHLTRAGPYDSISTMPRARTPTAGIGQPLFDAGKLRAGQRAAEARYQRGVAEYAKAVLNAFAEVEGAFLTREEQLKRRDYVLNFLEEARAAQRVAETRYSRGLVDYLSVLDAQRTRFQAESDLVNVDFAILNNRVTMHRALGGGWAYPGPVVAKKKR